MCQEDLGLSPIFISLEYLFTCFIILIIILIMGRDNIILDV